MTEDQNVWTEADIYSVYIRFWILYVYPLSYHIYHWLVSVLLTDKHWVIFGFNDVIIQMEIFLYTELEVSEKVCAS